MALRVRHTARVKHRRAQAICEPTAGTQQVKKKKAPGPSHEQAEQKWPSLHSDLIDDPLHIGTKYRSLKHIKRPSETQVRPQDLLSSSNSSPFGSANSFGHTIRLRLTNATLFGGRWHSKVTSYTDAHMMTKQAEGVWEAYTPYLSPLQTMKTVPDPLDVLGFTDPWKIHTRSSLESSESESDSGSDDGNSSSMSARSPTFQEDCLPPVDWGPAETVTELADNFLGLDFAPSQTRAEVRAVATSTPQARSLRAPTDHQDVHGRDRPNQKYHAPRRRAPPQSYDTASETLVVRCLQDTCLLGTVSNASGPKVREQMIECFSRLIREHRRPRRCARLLARRLTLTEGSNHARTMG